MSVTPRGMSIQEAYREYRAGNLRINRRYQRKLVWTKNEKRALIDSLIHHFPIPLILLAYTMQKDGSKRFEILDGMQRLNAIFTFIENDFDVDRYFFDVEQLARAKQLADEGQFSAEKRLQYLVNEKDCADLLDYQLAVTEFPANDETAVNEVFRRINSYGHQLSDQERRQAGVVNAFANVVRQLASEIRGDVSSDSLDLSDMPAISVDMAGEAPDYSIKADSTFWCKQGILRRRQLRDSEDEQMIADLVVSILEKEPFAFSGNNLDKYYDPDTDEYNTIDAALARYGPTRLKTEVVAVISELREVIETVDHASNAFRRRVHPEAGGNPVKTAFFAIFFAFFEMCVKRRMRAGNAARVMGALANIQKRLNVAAGQIRTEPRRQNIQIAIGLIQEHFVPIEPPRLFHAHGCSIQFENALRRSRIESSLFECKQGLCSLSEQRNLNVELIDGLIETICAIANVGPDAEGAIFVGVADNDRDRQKIENLDKLTAAHIGIRYVVGIERETRLLGEDLERYKRRIVDRIAASGLSQPLKSDVLAKIDCFYYRSFSVISIPITAQRSESTVDGVMFVREGSSTKRDDTTAGIAAVVRRFPAA